MANPWLKKNPLMSLWLSSAHSIAGVTGARLAAQARQQATWAAQQAVGEIVKFWTVAALAPTRPAPVAKRRKARK